MSRTFHRKGGRCVQKPGKPKLPLRVEEEPSEGAWFDFFLKDTTGTTLGELKAAELPIGSKKLWITSISIHKPYRGQGLGSHLLDHVIAHFDEKGYTEIYAEIEQTDGAVTADLDAFFAAHGFDPTELETGGRNTSVLCRRLRPEAK
ncbi:MAG: GNAT family N-acetyltransferase [Deltaproteobacteria bacterium]|nr:MAG: GNAT family N-acetyltransferase [Deltaproteobacteria bacterium]